MAVPAFAEQPDSPLLAGQAGYEARLFALSLHLLAVADFDGLLVHFNPARPRQLGCAPEVLRVTPCLNLVHQDDRDGALGVMRRLRAGEAIADFECRLVGADGEARWFSWVGIPGDDVFHLADGGGEIDRDTHQLVVGDPRVQQRVEGSAFHAPIPDGAP